MNHTQDDRMALFSLIVFLIAMFVGLRTLMKLNDPVYQVRPNTHIYRHGSPYIRRPNPYPPAGPMLPLWFQFESQENLRRARHYRH